MSTWHHFGSQNPLKSRLGGVLERLGSVQGASWGVLGPLRSVLERPGELWGRCRRFWKGSDEVLGGPGAPLEGEGGFAGRRFQVP